MKMRLLSALLVSWAVLMSAGAAPAAVKAQPKVKAGAVCPTPSSSKAPARQNAKHTAPPAAKKHGNAKTARALPRLLDLGAMKCVPCKMMATVMDELTKEYGGKLKVEFIDVRKNPKAAEKYKINNIPTQIFYDANGREFYRHIGYYPKEGVLAAFKKHGVDLSKPAKAEKK